MIAQKTMSETTRGYFAAMSTMETGPLAADLAALGREPLDPAAAARVARTSDTFAALMRTTCVPTELTGGHAENALPQMARATVNCRLLPCDPPDEVEATLRRLVGDPDVSLARLDLPARGAPGWSRSHPHPWSWSLSPSLRPAPPRQGPPSTLHRGRAA